MHYVTNYLQMLSIGKQNIFSTDDDGDECIDFEKIIPTPKTEEEYRKQGGLKYKSLAEDNIKPEPDRPWFNWLEWTLEHWGTISRKWPVVIDNDDEIHFVTSKIPNPIFKALSEQHSIFVLQTSIDLEDGRTLNQEWLNGKLLGEEIFNACICVENKQEVPAYA